LVTQGRACLFGDIVGDQMLLNDAGRIVADEWVRSAHMRPGIALDEWVVMPNHVQGIIVIKANRHPDGRGDLRSPSALAHPHDTPTGPTPESLGAILAGFKAAATRRINQLRGTPGAGLWQRNYFEHIIRDEDSFNRIRTYIIENPAHWDEDDENPARATR
jgi:REP element-mobilizing transposase RayT